MLTDERRVLDALDPGRLKLPASLPVVRIEARFTTGIMDSWRELAQR